jgi:hypothetical protein
MNLIRDPNRFNNLDIGYLMNRLVIDKKGFINFDSVIINGDRVLLFYHPGAKGCESWDILEFI